MAKKKPRRKRWPKYCGPHKERGYAYCWFEGKRIYFSPHRHGTRESYADYERFCREHCDAEVPEQPPLTNECSVMYLGVEYMKHAEKYYQGSTELGRFKTVVQFLIDYDAQTQVADFGPKRLQFLCEEMIAVKDWNVSSIRDNLGRIRRVFKWGVSQELVHPDVWRALESVEAPRVGRSDVRPADKTDPVPLADVLATIKELSAIVGAMVELQLLTGMRSDNLCQIRLADIDQSGDVWLYVPERHKMAWKAKGLVILLGPKSIDRLQPWLKRDREAFLFSPREARALDAAARHARRKDRKRKSRSSAESNEQFGDCYKTSSYRQAVQRGAKRAGVPKWFPRQLRHTRATEIRKTHGIEAAQVYLGHSSADTTQIYAERDLQLAIKVARDLG